MRQHKINDVSNSQPFQLQIITIFLPLQRESEQHVHDINTKNHRHGTDGTSGCIFNQFFFERCWCRSLSVAARETLFAFKAVHNLLQLIINARGADF